MNQPKRVWIDCLDDLPTVGCEFRSGLRGGDCDSVGAIRVRGYVPHNIRDIDNPQVLCLEHSKFIVRQS